MPIYALVASATGFGAYYALGGAYSNDVPKAFKKAQEKSPLDPKEFKDFKLKKVIPYNDNTSTYVLPFIFSSGYMLTWSLDSSLSYRMARHPFFP